MKTKKERKDKVKIGMKAYLKVGRRSLREYWGFAKFNLLGQLFLQTIIAVGTIGSVYVASRVLGEVIKSAAAGSATDSLYPLLILQLAIFAITTLANTLGGLLVDLLFIKNEEHYILKLNSARADLDTEFYEDRNNQKLIAKVDQKGVWAMYEMYMQLIYMYSNTLKLTLVIGLALQVGVLAVIILVIATLPRLYANLSKSKVKWSIWQTEGDDRHIYSKTINKFHDDKSLLEIKLYGLKNRLLHQIAGTRLKDFNKISAKASKSAMKPELAADLIYESSYFAITVLLVGKTVSGVYSVADFSFYLGSLGQFNGAINNITNVISRINEYMLYAKDLFELIDSDPVIKSPENALKLNKQVIPTIEFKNVGFHYRSNPEDYVLRNLNLTINPGEHLALVGENGAGKTTIIKLMLRLYDVSEGEILVNGINIKELDLNSYWKQIGVLFQDFNKYPFDIQTNIELGRVNKKPTKKEIARAVELANMDPILKKLPKGLQTILDNSFEEGVEPSGGQWQRVALARAFYRNSNILILDEPTAAVDANAEYEIFNNIFAHYGEKTALIISHRFSTVKRASRIVVLQKGKIVEEGTHRDLMKNSKLYAEMFTKQAEGYRD